MTCWPKDKTWPAFPTTKPAKQVNKLFDVSAQKESARNVYGYPLEKIAAPKGQNFFVVCDRQGKIYFQDFREKSQGAKKAIEDINSPVSCILAGEGDLLIFAEDEKARLIDYRSRKLIVNENFGEFVQCAAFSESGDFVYIANEDIKLMVKDSLEITKVHKVDKGSIASILREEDSIVFGGFDCELKVA